jgi:hypothetical protein
MTFMASCRLSTARLTRSGFLSIRVCVVISPVMACGSVKFFREKTTE